MRLYSFWAMAHKSRLSSCSVIQRLDEFSQVLSITKSYNMTNMSLMWNNVRTYREWYRAVSFKLTYGLHTQLAIMAGANERKGPGEFWAKCTATPRPRPNMFFLVWFFFF